MHIEHVAILHKCSFKIKDGFLLASLPLKHDKCSVKFHTLETHKRDISAAVEILVSQNITA